MAERLRRRYSGLRFHVCKECGARGSHIGRRRRRPVESPAGKVRRVRTRRRAFAALVAILLGTWIGYYAASCERERPQIDERP